MKDLIDGMEITIDVSEIKLKRNKPLFKWIDKVLPCTNPIINSNWVAGAFVEKTLDAFVEKFNEADDFDKKQDAIEEMYQTILEKLKRGTGNNFSFSYSSIRLQAAYFELQQHIGKIIDKLSKQHAKEISR